MQVMWISEAINNEKLFTATRVDVISASHSVNSKSDQNGLPSGKPSRKKITYFVRVFLRIYHKPVNKVSCKIYRKLLIYMSEISDLYWTKNSRKVYRKFLIYIYIYIVQNPS